MVVRSCRTRIIRHPLRSVVSSFPRTDHKCQNLSLCAESRVEAIYLGTCQATKEGSAHFRPALRRSSINLLDFPLKDPASKENSGLSFITSAASERACSI